MQIKIVRGKEIKTQNCVGHTIRRLTGEDEGKIMIETSGLENHSIPVVMDGKTEVQILNDTGETIQTLTWPKAPPPRPAKKKSSKKDKK